jgi:hypothetical protein
MLDKTNFVQVLSNLLGSARDQSVSNPKKAAAARSTGLRPIHFSNRGNSHGSQLQAAIITKL